MDAILDSNSPERISVVGVRHLPVIYLGYLNRVTTDGSGYVCRQRPRHVRSGTGSKVLPQLRPLNCLGAAKDAFQSASQFRL